MAYVLDLIVIAIVAVTAFLGYRRGFIRTIIQLLSCVVAFALALSLSTTVATYVYENFLHEGLHQNIETAWNDTVVEGATNTVTEQVGAVLDTLPPFLTATLDTDALVNDIVGSMGVGDAGAAVADYLTENVLRPVIVAVLEFLSFLALYLVLSLLIRLLEKLVTPIIKLPLIRQTDGVLGTIVGLLKGVVFSFVAVMIMQLIATGAASGPFTQENLDNSVLAGWLADINPLSSILYLK